MSELVLYRPLAPRITSRINLNMYLSRRGRISRTEIYKSEKNTRNKT